LADMARKTQQEQKLDRYDVERVERPSGERWISLSNALTRSAQRLTLSEKRIVSAAVAKLNSPENVTRDHLTVTKITAAEYSETFGVDADTAYNQLKAAGDNLQKRQITFYEPLGKRKTPVRVKMQWIGEAHYHEGEGWIELYWWPRVLPYLTGLHREFTQYQLKQASALRSIYSWRLLELLSQYKDTGWLRISIEEFAHAMDATDKQRGDFAMIRRRMIEPAVKELSDKDGWLIRWLPIKSGRRIAALRFEFQRNPQGRLPLDEIKQDIGSPPLALDAPKPKPPQPARARRAPPPVFTETFEKLKGSKATHEPQEST
jgi:plasmid replication initiation protein